MKTHLVYNYRLLVSIFCCLAFGTVYGQRSVTIHSPGAGLLPVTDNIWYTTTSLKITGNINAVDFQRIKKMPALRDLDLSEAVIESYKGSDGCYEPVLSESPGGNRYHEYPANMFPVHAFTFVVKSLTGAWHEGSNKLQRIVMPDHLVGIEKDAFKGCKALMDFSASGHFGAIQSVDGVIYSADGQVLLACPPCRNRSLDILSTVNSIADNALDNCSFPYVVFHSQQPPSIGNNTFATAYVEAPSPELYSNVLGDIDVVKTISPIIVNVSDPGTLIDELAKQSLLREDIRSLVISGILNKEDWEWLKNLPNLYYLDLSNMNWTELPSPCPVKLCGITLPSSLQKTEGLYGLFLTGTIVLPQSVEEISPRTLFNSPVTSVKIPSSVKTIGKESFNNTSIRTIDLSLCSSLYEIGEGCFSNCNQLEEIKFPHKLTSIGSNAFSSIPIKSVVFPASLATLKDNAFTNTAIESLDLSEGFVMLNQAFNYSTSLSNVVFKNAKALRAVSGFRGCSLLENVDFSECYTLLSLDAFGSERGAVLDNSSSQAFLTTIGRSVPFDSLFSYCISGLKQISFPSNLIDVNGFSNCFNLINLDFTPCFRLKVINGFLSCKSLKELILPGSLDTLSNAFVGSQSLIHIVSPAIKPPLVNKLLPFANIVVEVPIGLKGKYVLTENWTKASKINEIGYSAIISTVYPSLFPIGVLPVIKGQGLHAVSSPSALDITPISGLKFSHWKDDKGVNYYQENLPLTQNRNTIWQAYFDYDMEMLKANVMVDIEARIDTIIDFGGSALCYPFRVIYGKNQYLDISENGTKELLIPKGFSKLGILGDLTSFYLKGNRNVKATDVHLNNCTKLDRISLYDNKLPNIDLSSAENLKDVSCSNNQIETLILPSGIVSLSCSSNIFTDLDLPYPNLRNLECRFNNVRSIDLSSCSATLEYLDISKSKLDHLDLSMCTKLNNLVAQYCNLKTIKFNQNVSLKNIYLGYNFLKDLDVSSCEKLEYINIERNMFAFSAVTPELYKLLGNSRRYFLSTESSDYFTVINVGDTIDLSKELYTKIGTAETVFNVSVKTGYKILSPGVYHFTKDGYYEISLANPDAPGLFFYTTLYVMQPVGIGPATIDDELSVDVNGRTITVRKLDKDSRIQLLDASGLVLQAENPQGNDTFSFMAAVHNKGVYFLRIIKGSEKFKTKKIILD